MLGLSAIWDGWGGGVGACDGRDALGGTMFRTGFECEPSMPLLWRSVVEWRLAAGGGGGVERERVIGLTCFIFPLFHVHSVGMGRVLAHE